MNGNLAIDVSILAVMVAMYVTKQDDKMIVILMVCLMSHMFITKDDHLDSDGTDVEIYNHVNVVDRTPVEIENLGTSGDETPLENEKVIVEPMTKPVSLKQQSKTVSNGVFDRQLSTPQTNFTSSIFPNTSSEANGKLAEARGSFFKSLVS